MRIVSLRLKNLNSLRGEWSIDFEGPHYTSNGIFALTGPTGAGKSTLLDAICLALYGATPRLGKITVSGNDVMSRGTGECYAEVVFESKHERFLCHWAQRRARKKPDGKLQNQVHSIAKAVSGELIETKVSKVVELVESKTGMDFERFTRSVLLAQGDFDTFLKANAEDKSKILEQITGTQIYSDISIAVHERRRVERDALAILQAEMSGAVLLSDEEELQLRDSLSECQTQEAAASEQQQQLNNAVRWLQNIENLAKELDKAQRDKRQHDSEQMRFKADRVKLHAGEQAATVDGVYSVLQQHRKNKGHIEAQLKAHLTRFPELKSRADVVKVELATIRETFDQCEKALKERRPVFAEVRRLDRNIKEKRQELSELEQDATAGEDDFHRLTDAVNTLVVQREKLLVDKQEAQNYLAKNAEDERLLKMLAGIEAKVDRLKESQESVQNCASKIEQESKRYLQAKEALENCSRRCVEKEQAYKESTARLDTAEAILAGTLNNKTAEDYEGQREQWQRELLLHRRIQELEDHRAQLQDGVDCPLCGATEHPYARGNVPKLSEAEQEIAKLDTLLSDIKQKKHDVTQLEKAQSDLLLALTGAKHQQQTASDSVDHLKRAVDELSDSYRAMEADHLYMQKTLTQALAGLGIEWGAGADYEKVLGELKQRDKTWQEQTRRLADIDGSLNRIDTGIAREEALKESCLARIEKSEQAVVSQKQRVEHYEAERRVLFDDKNPDVEEQAIEAQRIEIKKSVREKESEQASCDSEVLKSEAKIEALVKEQSENKLGLVEADSRFADALSKAGFKNEEALKAAHLSIEDRQELQDKAKSLDDNTVRVNTQCESLQERLKRERARMLSEKTQDTLESELVETEAVLNALRDRIATTNHRLVENDKAKESLRERQKALRDQQKECEKWSQLHELIGSSDGKKYRSFAQGLTFNIMISHANQQLSKMSDRYQLVHRESQPLALFVIDNYQAGEVRPTKNLSGGESFIVSLALALGLSNMASRKVRVDSLFLDEGFGTLDEHSLETALDTLASLQHDGKLIGVISHVAALKERISTQIVVAPASGGRSLLSGPGVEQLS